MTDSDNRIGRRLGALRKAGKKALVSYIVNGDPQPQATLAAMHALVQAGTDIIELGVPFSDPMAEGPVIQRGHERALEHGTSLRSTMALVAEFRKDDADTPIVLMGYANPVVRMGFAAFAKAANEAGVDGLLTVDLPPEEAGELNAELKAQNIENIFLIAPTTTEARIADICKLASGFIYYVSLKGVTGAGHLDIDSVSEKLSLVRQHTKLPLLVGFGIKNAETAQKVGSVADGVVVGSLYVSAMGEQLDASPEQCATLLKTLVEPIRAGLDKLAS